jgi:pimeloyl-ACP methyl ester carboxylesterase
MTWFPALAIVALALLALAVTVAYFLPRMQRSMLFPAPQAPARAAPAGMQSVWFEAPEIGGRVEAWFCPLATTPGQQRLRPAVVFAHGNGELIDHWPEVAETLNAWGYSTLLLEYPGYGRSSGSPSQDSIRATSRAAYDWLVEQPGVDRRRIVGYGRSLGAAAIAQLARDRRLAGLILESTFISVAAMARGFGIPAALVRDPFDTLAVIEQYEGPVLVLHGARDDIVPVAHGEALAAAAGVELVRMPCGHNDCPRPWRQIKQFLKTTFPD